MEVAEGVHRLTGGIANFYLIEEGGSLVLIDAGTPNDWELFTEASAALHYDLADLDAVLITHAHSDHTGFAERARTTAEARVWIHEADRTGITSGATGKADGGMSHYLLRAQMYRTMLSLGRRGAAKIVPVHEVSTFGDGELIDVPGKPRAIHAPGHTAGSSALYLERRGILLTGDVMATWNPFTGRPGPQIMPSAMNVDTDQALASLDTIAEVPADLLLPGHGDPWRGRPAEAVQRALEAGRS